VHRGSSTYESLFISSERRSYLRSPLSYLTSNTYKEYAKSDGKKTQVVKSLKYSFDLTDLWVDVKRLFQKRIKRGISEKLDASETVALLNNSKPLSIMIILLVY
jgi:hypothetical protein